MNTETKNLDILGFIEENSLTYTEILDDYNTFIETLSEDEKLGFKTLFEGTNSKILTEMLAAKTSDELYHIIASRGENLMYYLNRQDSAIALAQNYSYSAFRGSNILLKLTLVPSETASIKRLDSIGIAEDYELIARDDIELQKGVETTVYAYVGHVKEESLTANTEDMLIFRFTSQNISDQIALFLNDKEVPTTTNILDMTDDKYFCITNAYTGVDALYLNKRTDSKYSYTNGSTLKLKYIEYSNIGLNSLELQSTYGDITSVSQESGTVLPETVSDIKQNGPLYAETQNRIVARDDFEKVLKASNPELSSSNGHDYSNAIVEVSYVKKDGTLMTDAEYNKAYNNLYKRRSFGIPMCRIEHPKILTLPLAITIQLVQGNSVNVTSYVRTVLSNYEKQLDSTLDLSSIEHDLENYTFVKTARASLSTTSFSPNTVVQPGTVIKPTIDNGKVYIVSSTLYLTGAEAPSWSAIVGTETVDNDIIWKCEAKSYTPQPYWSADTPKVIDDIVRVDTYANVQFRCIGYNFNTSTTEPTWPTELGKTVVDGRILWTAVAKDATAEAWAKEALVKVGQVVNSTTDTSYSYQVMAFMPITGDTEPTWVTDLTVIDDGSIEYFMIDETYNAQRPDLSQINLDWNQYSIMNETITVV